jgi:hypothetical protein
MATGFTTSAHQLVLRHWWLPISTMPAKEIFPDEISGQVLSLQRLPRFFDSCSEERQPFIGANEWSLIKSSTLSGLVNQCRSLSTGFTHGYCCSTLSKLGANISNLSDKVSTFWFWLFQNKI